MLRKTQSPAEFRAIPSSWGFMVRHVVAPVRYVQRLQRSMFDRLCIPACFRCTACIVVVVALGERCLCRSKDNSSRSPVASCWLHAGWITCRYQEFCESRLANMGSKSPMHKLAITSVSDAVDCWEIRRAAVTYDGRFGSYRQREASSTTLPPQFMTRTAMTASCPRANRAADIKVKS